MRARKIVPYIPEIYLLISIVYYWTLTATLWNPFAIGLLMLIVFQVLKQNKVTGILISSIFIFLNFFLILALISELSEFPEFNSDAKILAFLGFSYLILNIVMGALMLIKHLTKQNTIISTIEVKS